MGSQLKAALPFRACHLIRPTMRQAERHQHRNARTVINAGAVLVNLELQRMGSKDAAEIQRLDAQIAELQAKPPDPTIDMPASSSEDIKKLN